jgi:hypothetical protein
MHGGEYKILFMRGQQAIVPQAAPPFEAQAAVPAQVIGPPPETADNPYRSPSQEVQTCARHPETKTDQNCARCGVAVCATCGFPQADGAQFCPECVGKARVLPSLQRGVPEGTMCSGHPEVQAEHYCKSCRAPICATCDFALPGGIHVCPTCATKTNKGLSSKRKTLVGWSYALAVWSTVGIALMFSGAFAEMAADEEAIGLVYSLFIFTPSLVGTALSVGALDRRLGNPPAVWCAIIWNGVVIVANILLIIIGNLMMMQ